jgi:hypothetical protein
MIVAERFRADESGFAETGASHTKRLLVAMFTLFKEMERTGIEPVTSGLQSCPRIHSVPLPAGDLALESRRGSRAVP